MSRLSEWGAWIWGGLVVLAGAFFAAFMLRRKPQEPPTPPTYIRDDAAKREREEVAVADALLEAANDKVADVVDTEDADERNDNLSDLLNER